MSSTNDNVKWYCILVDSNGGDYGVCDFENKYTSDEQQMDLIIKYWGLAPPKPAVKTQGVKRDRSADKENDSEGEREESDSDSEEEENSDWVGSDGKFAVDFLKFGAIDEEFIDMLCRLKDHDGSKHQDYFLFSTSEVEERVRERATK